MTTPDPSVIVASRRATAMLAHWTAHDAEGFRAVLGELKSVQDTVDLCMGLCTASQLLGERVFGDRWPTFLASHAMGLASWGADLAAGEDEP